MSGKLRNTFNGMDQVKAKPTINTQLSATMMIQCGMAGVLQGTVLLAVDRGFLLQVLRAVDITATKRNLWGK